MACLEGDGELLGAFVGGAHEPVDAVILLLQEGDGIRHADVLEAGVEDGAAHKLLLALPLLPLRLWVIAKVQIMSNTGARGHGVTQFL